MLDPLLTLSGTELARRIRAGETTSREIVERHVARIEEVNPRLNAVVRDRFAEARTEADAADLRVRQERRDALPPFLGVPCTIKESIALAGMPNTCGVVARAHVVASEDASTVARWRAAGAIPLGVTNVPELTAWTTTFNRIYGRTSNAYHPDHVSGGSSGGEGAIIGAGGSPFGLGTDVGGSIRVPAFCNGIFGHKPTGGLVPSSGQFPAFEGKLQRINTTGPLARRAEDLMPLLRLLAGPDGIDDQCRPMELGDPAAVDITKVRAFVVPGDGLRPGVAREIREAQERAGRALAERGAAVATRLIPALRRAGVFTLGLMLEEGHEPIPSGLGETVPPGLGGEVLRWMMRRSAHTYPAILVPLMTSLFLRFPRRIARAVEEGRRFRDELEASLGDDGVLLYPLARGPVPRHGGGAVTYFRFAALFNALEMPSTHVPLGFDAVGLPLGIQVVAARGRDHLTIAVALALESALGGWTPPESSRPGG